MREIEGIVELNQTQKIRLQKALLSLSSSSTLSSSSSVTVADPITFSSHDSILKGHGTVNHDGELLATYCGVVERVDKLVYVRSFGSRYKPEVGEIVVGRVVEVAQKQWRIEINAYHDGVLLLSSVTLPDGIQRRRTAVDELNMRNIFEENDVIAVEVRSKNGFTAQLQARSDKYGKLNRGQLITVPCYLVKKQNQHFHQLQQYKVLLILGCNGYIWVGELIESKDRMEVDQVSKSGDKEMCYTNFEDEEQSYTSLRTRENICRIANAVRVLSSLSFSITVEVILEIFELSMSLNVGIHDMLGAEFCVLVAEKEADRRNTTSRRKRQH